ncbi:diguanylate cyclase domain-containing protein [Actinoplanes awajinensis]|uniref:diguanylate cyclase domain-containing protein n=1 Tax=Actinoplanes awajinensis TaxID=135946 RepID=UPI0009FEEE78
MLENLSAPVHLPAFGEGHIGASIGVAVAETGISAAELLRQADQAMYDAKREGRNRLSVADRTR